MEIDLNNTKELISEIKKGNMVLLMDDEDREMKGILFLLGKVSAEKINFMAKHARGLICLAMSQSKCEALNLNQMVNDNKSGHGTALLFQLKQLRV